MEKKSTVILISFIIIIIAVLVLILYKHNDSSGVKGDDSNTIPVFENSFFNLNVDGKKLYVPKNYGDIISKEGEYSSDLAECASKNSSDDRNKDTDTCKLENISSIIDTVETKEEDMFNFFLNYIKNTAGNDEGSPYGFYAQTTKDGFEKPRWNKVLKTTATSDVNCQDEINKLAPGKENISAFGSGSKRCIGFSKGDITLSDDNSVLLEECKKNSSLSSSVNYIETIPNDLSYFETDNLSSTKRCSLDGQIRDIGNSINNWVRSDVLNPDSQVPPYIALDENNEVIKLGTPLKDTGETTLLKNSAGHVCIGFVDNVQIPFQNGKEDSTVYKTQEECYADFPCMYLSRVRNTKDKTCNVNTCQNRDSQLTADQTGIKWSELADDHPMWVSAKSGCYRKLSDTHPLDGKKGKCECNVGFSGDCSADHGKSTMDITQQAAEQEMSIKCWHKSGGPLCPKCEGVLLDNVAADVNKNIKNFTNPHYYCSMTGSPATPYAYRWVKDVPLPFQPMSTPIGHGEVPGQIDPRCNSANLSDGAKANWKGNSKVAGVGCSPSTIPDAL